MGGKVWLFAVVLGAVCAAALAGPSPRLLGTRDKACTWGPSYWCQNITTAKGCGAVKHCIQTVWEHMTLPEDNDDICTLCKNMVKEARDQLESNETQEELREVFEGSCNLIPLKPVAEGCDKLVDEFIPELVETLASQMNPQVVCSVAGLCNNAEIDRMLAAEGKLTKVPLVKSGSSISVIKPVEAKKSDCNTCYSTLHKLQKKVKMTDRDDLLNKFIEGCGMMGSLSDGCAALVVTHFADIQDTIEKSLQQPDESCEMMQYCTAGEAQKSQVNVDVTPVGQVGIVPVLTDNMTCQFCERMVQHLRDILVANTTESEFQQVMEGLCKQMKPKYKDECLTIVTEYYGMIYNFLVNNLNGQEICSFAGLCPSPGVSVHAPIWPLLPAEMNVKEVLAGALDSQTSENPVVEISVSSDSAKVEVQDPASYQLPIERMMTPQVLVNIGSNKEICEFCEYFLHFVQTELASEKTVEKVKAVVEGACDRLPATINNQCKDFVDAYGNAFIAIIVQEIDPSLVCPGMGFCPSKENSRILLVGTDEKFDDKPGCPLCLLAVEQLETIVKDNKTEESVKAALESLCMHLPKSLVGECDNFVDTYSAQLVDMLIADFTPQEVCVYIKLCSANKSSEEVVSGDILTNEVPQYENQKLQKNFKEDPQCVICEFAMSRIDSMLKNNASEAEIKEVVHKVCSYMPKTVVPQCNKFVDEYADLVITLLAQELDPKVVCTELKLCKPNLVRNDRVALSLFQQHTKKNIQECAICEGVIQALDTYLQDPNVEEEIDDLLIRACGVLPAKQYSKCRNFIKIPGETHLICEKMGVCVRSTGAVQLLGGRKCTWGPGYWCQSEENAKACGPGTLLHCQEHVWKGRQP
ncbi:Prosaposin [Frankliniella fusca]|uniref:Pulmonary surfactant-associated protein B n=1 Tax=Frankliniella fusca TaxID=407009 RepID=A0AAE1LNE0_9NEOP|nr:Prosaposin [Frankliniella fusca]